MSWRFRRQFAAVSILLLFLGIFGVVLYWRLKPLPTCSDSKKNQNELNVDCGGPCEPCELKHPKGVTVLWARTVSVSPGAYDAVAYIKNPNEILASNSFEYRFSLFDERGLVAERSGTTYLYPQEKTYIVEAGIPAERPPTRVEFAVVRAEWLIHKESPPGILVRGKEYRIERETARVFRGIVEADLFNDTPFDVRSVDVHFLLFDKDDNLIGANTTLVEQFMADTDRNVRTVWPEAIPGIVTSIIVEPRVNVFSPTWLIEP